MFKVIYISFYYVLCKYWDASMYKGGMLYSEVKKDDLAHIYIYGGGVI